MTFFNDAEELDEIGPLSPVKVRIDELASMGVSWAHRRALEQAIYGDWVRNWLIDPQYGRIDVPVGPRILPPLDISGPGIPQLVPEIAAPSQAGIPEEIDRRDKPNMPLSNEDWLIKMGMAPAVTVLPQPLFGDEGEGMSVFEDWYDAADRLAGGWLPGGPVSPFDVTPPLTGFWPPSATPAAPPVGAPPMPIATPGPMMDPCNPGPSPVYKKVCGIYKWVYPKRRRRKALATRTDIKSLAALKGVIGGGKTLDTWIATHS